MATPTPKPTALRIVEGTRDVVGHRTVNKQEPKPKKARPKIPSLIQADDPAKKHYDDLVKLTEGMRVLTVADGDALGKLAYLEAQFNEIADIVRKSGFLVENPRSGNVRINPLLGQMSNMLTHITRLYQQFGFTPASRVNVKTTAGQGDNEWSDF